MAQKNYFEIYNWIYEGWQKSVRFNFNDEGENIGLPFPFIVPCPDGETMQNMFYWDTYFINLGLLEQGLIDQARHNVENLVYLLQKFGFVPNGSLKIFLNRSQPPLLLPMIWDIFQYTNDYRWLERNFKIWKLEYKFWMQHRMSSTGLNCHSNHATREELLDFYNEELAHRLPLRATSAAQKMEIANHYLAEAETGWDFTPRFEGKCLDYLNIELNALLYHCEKLSMKICEILSDKDFQNWENRADKRRQLYWQYHWDEADGIFRDYNFKNKRFSPVASSAAFVPLWAEMAIPEQASAVADNLKRFEFDHGIAVCEKNNSEVIFQWDYPNGWPPVFYFVVEGLKKYSFSDEAQRIAAKFLDLVSSVYQTTGQLWEKYNVVDGSINVKDEYKMPPMLGWTAGVFVHFYNYLHGENI